MQVWSHHLGVAQRLKGERRALLLNVRPVDAAEWHVELCKLLDEESDLMEVERMGRLVEASPPPLASALAFRRVDRIVGRLNS